MNYGFLKWCDNHIDSTFRMKKTIHILNVDLLSISQEDLLVRMRSPAEMPPVQTLGFLQGLDFSPVASSIFLRVIRSKIGSTANKKSPPMMERANVKANGPM